MDDVLSPQCLPGISPLSPRYLRTTSMDEVPALREFHLAGAVWFGLGVGFGAGLGVGVGSGFGFGPDKGKGSRASPAQVQGSV